MDRSASSATPQFNCWSIRNPPWNIRPRATQNPAWRSRWRQRGQAAGVRCHLAEHRTLRRALSIPYMGCAPQANSCQEARAFSPTHGDRLGNHALTIHSFTFSNFRRFPGRSLAVRPTDCHFQWILPVTQVAQVLFRHAKMMTQFVQHGDTNLTAQLLFIDSAAPINGRRKYPLAIDVNRIGQNA
jgi:hypothetical protein